MTKSNWKIPHFDHHADYYNRFERATMKRIEMLQTWIEFFVEVVNWNSLELQWRSLRHIFQFLVVFFSIQTDVCGSQWEFIVVTYRCFTVFIAIYWLLFWWLVSLGWFQRWPDDVHSSCPCSYFDSFALWKWRFIKMTFAGLFFLAPFGSLNETLLTQRCEMTAALMEHWE